MQYICFGLHHIILFEDDYKFLKIGKNVKEQQYLLHAYTIIYKLVSNW
jgi:hypothetical protein